MSTRAGIEESRITPGAFEGLVEMVNMLQSESLVYYEDLDHGDFRQRARRQFGRAFVAGVEAASWTFRRLALSRHYSGDFEHSPGDLAMLRQESYRINEKGHSHAERQRTAFARTVLFTHRLAATAHGFEFDLRSDQGEWQRFERVVAIRNRLTHPTSLMDLAVSDEEAKDLRQGHIWYWDRAITLMGKIAPYYSTVSGT